MFSYRFKKKMVSRMNKTSVYTTKVSLEIAKYADSPLCLVWVRTPHWPRETNQVLLEGVPGAFSRGSPVFAHLLIGRSHMS